MKNPNKKPAIQAEVDLSYSKGTYTFFCKSVAALFAAVIGILSAAGATVTGSPARGGPETRPAAAPGHITKRHDKRREKKWISIS